MWELDYKESWVLKNWCFWAVVLEKNFESPLDCEEIQPIHPKGDQSWVFIGRTDVEAETPILWPPDAKSWLLWKDPDAGKDWVQEEKGTTEDKMVGWHHQLNGHGFGWTPGVGDGQGGLACCSSWDCKESDTTEWLNWTELKEEWTFHWGRKITIGLVRGLWGRKKKSLETCMFMKFGVLSYNSVWLMKPGMKIDESKILVWGWIMKNYACMHICNE